MTNSKLSCDIINDLLPLYIDDTLSEESKNAVALHLSSCSKCRQAATVMNSAITGSESLGNRDNTLFIQIQKKLRRKIIFRIIIAFVVFLFIWVASNMYLAAHYAPVNPKAQAEYIEECLTVVLINDEYFLQQTDFFAQGEICLLQCKNGEINFYLGENGIRSLGLARSYSITPRYQQLIKPGIMDEVHTVNYCKPDGTVITTLWQANDPLPQLTTQ